jgi:Tol biopolymer transport system component
VLQPDTCEGGQVIVFYPDHRRLNLSAGFHSACDPEVSYDGQRILFAAKKTAVDNWNVYETGSDGSGLRQVTKGLGDCRNPLYLSTLYTLISDKPWHQIAFVSNMTKTAGEYGPWPVTGIYSSRIDGTGLMRLTHDPSGDSDPFQMSDGRLLFSGWRPRLPDRPARLPLYAVNIDGTDFMLFADSEGLKYKRMPCVTTRRLAVFVESEQLRPDGAGYLACVTLRRNLHSYKRLTKPGEGLFRSPSPIADGRILVSRKPEERQGRFGICVYDPDSGSVLPVFDDPKFDEIQAKILAPRAEPDGRSTSVLRRTGEIEDPHALERQDRKSGPRELPSGRLYCINVYNSDFIAPAALKRGTVRRVRVLEGLLPPAAASASRGGAADSTGSAGSPATEGALLLRRRFVGEAPVEEDGSFNLHVPANIPLELQILDADGLSLASCSWIWVKNNEPRGCIGCHEDQELVPENRLVTAVAKPSLELVLPPERRRSVDFLHDVEPIIRSRCVSCHKTGGTTPRLDESPDPARTSSGDHPDGPYERLLDHRQEENVGKVPGWRYVTAGRARTSPLIWHIFGRNTSQPWDPPLPAGAFRPMPPLNGGMLSEDERRTFVEWIDTGAQWDSRSSRNGTVTRQNSRDTAKP